MLRTIPIAIVVFFISCSSKKDGPGENVREIPKIAVVNYPLYCFAKSIAGDKATVYLPSLEGDPAYWKPSARQVINFQNADLILTNGAGYAKWLEKVSLPSSKIVNTSGSFKDQWIETDEVLVHSHGPEGEHSHKGTAITTWLNFKFALRQAATVHSALSKLLPGSFDELDKNFEALKVRLSELDARMVSASSDLSHLIVAASHPVYQYLEAGYKLSMVSLHWEPDEMPNEEQWDHFSGLVNAHKIRIMLWEDEPAEEIKLKMEELGVKTVVFNPCGNKPENGEFIEMMNNNIGQLERAIAGL